MDAEKKSMKTNINLEFLGGNAGRILGDNRNNAAVNLCKDEGIAVVVESWEREGAPAERHDALARPLLIRKYVTLGSFCSSIS